MSSDDKIKKLLSKLVFKSKLYLYLLKQKVFFKYIEALSLFMKKQIVIFISGKGSNALNIINYFSETEFALMALKNKVPINLIPVKIKKTKHSKLNFLNLVQYCFEAIEFRLREILN